LADTLDQVRGLLESRIAELGVEEKRLNEALKQLAGGAARTDGKRRAGKSRRPGARRAAPGQRRKELLKVIAVKPGAPVSEIAADMGVNPGQVYDQVNKAHADKLIVKKGKGFAVK
jgi:hypothetical protein